MKIKDPFKRIEPSEAISYFETQRHENDFCLTEYEDLCERSIDAAIYSIEKVTKQENYLRNLIVMLAEKDNYQSLSEPEFKKYVCKEIGMSEEEFDDLIEEDEEELEKWDNYQIQIKDRHPRSFFTSLTL